MNLSLTDPLQYCCCTAMVSVGGPLQLLLLNQRDTVAKAHSENL